ncbi:hypothetical protein PRZ48_009976 [Zasmidium cellare]|uniref:Uncharacterized protein n=1 Tax=Zasmidium cellare TaxID=395010 RepID=A0ABR0EDX8_ZASCE|nr:hypothetical protein PRZ48_009976 [Zasmidium cellare]
MEPIHAILEAAKTFESTQIQLEKLKSERDGVASQLQQQKQEFQSSTKDKRVGLKRKIKSVTESFHQEEAILEAKLAELRQKHEKEVSNLESQLDAVRQQFEDVTGPLCMRQQEIDENINEREQILQQLEQRLLARTGEGEPIPKKRRASSVPEEHSHPEATLADSPFAGKDPQNDTSNAANNAVKRRSVSLEVGGEYGGVKASTPDPEPIAMPSTPVVPDTVDPKKRKASAPAMGTSPQSSTTPKLQDDPTRRQSLTSIDPSLDPRRANRRNQSVPSSLSTPMPVRPPAPIFAPKTVAAPAPTPDTLAAQNRYKFDSNPRIAMMARAYADSPRSPKSGESSPRKKFCQGNGKAPHDLFRR